MARQVPQTILAGDTVKFTVDAYPYSSADGYGLSLKLSGPSGTPQKFSYNATANSGTKFDVRVAPADSANLAAGLYSYALVAASNTDSYTVESGTVTVEVRADLSGATDLRSHNQKVLDAICAVIENRATQDQQSYTIAGRTLTRTPIKDLIELKKYYTDLVNQEQGKSSAGPKKLFVRFSNNA